VRRVLTMRRDLIVIGAERGEGIIVAAGKAKIRSRDNAASKQGTHIPSTPLLTAPPSPLLRSVIILAQCRAHTK
jgi:hypothetical protein